MVGTREPDFRRAATPAVLADEEARRGEEARFRAALELELGPGDPVDAVPDQHVALAPDLVGREVVAKPVGEHRLAARAQFDLARRFDRLLAGAFEAIGAQEDRAVRSGAAARGARTASASAAPEADGSVGSGLASAGGTSLGAGCQRRLRQRRIDLRGAARPTAPRPRAARGAQRARTRWGVSRGIIREGRATWAPAFAMPMVKSRILVHRVGISPIARGRAHILGERPMPASAPNHSIPHGVRPMTAAAGSDARLRSLSQWTTQTLRTGAFALAPASADASFRRYFRDHARRRRGADIRR